MCLAIYSGDSSCSLPYDFQIPFHRTAQHSIVITVVVSPAFDKFANRPRRVQHVPGI